MLSNFGETQNVAITLLVDNHADLFVKSTDTVKYFTKKPLLAEHGFAALIDLQDTGIRILWDAGITPLALLENMKRMEIDPRTIKKIVLSHGHDDHTAGVTDLLRWLDIRPKAKEWGSEATMEEMGRWAQVQRIPVIAHPGAFRERWFVDKEGKRMGPVLPPPRAEWEAVGAEVILSEGPYELGPGCWTTGEIPRLSFEKSGRPSTLFYRQDDQFVRDDIEEDQAIVLYVKDKGLVILSGCAHSGIVNTINAAREISGVERVWAVLGGFHLARATEDEIQETVAAVKKFKPVMIVPSHCTGFKVVCRFAARMPEEFALGIVGTTYLF